MTFRILNADPLNDYREACKITRGIEYSAEDFKFKPKDETAYWIRRIVENHSTVRSVRFRMADETPKSVVMQIIRATKGHPQPFVQSSRPDWNGGRERSPDPYELKLFMQDHTAESFIEMAKQRLCARTEDKTRGFMALAVESLKLSGEPFLRAVGWCCRPYCWWYGACPETRGCGKFPKLADRIVGEYEETL